MEIKMENPIGLNGIEFVEYTSPNDHQLEKLFTSFAFSVKGVHRDRPITLFRQGDVNFLINNDRERFAGEFQSLHGPSICSVGFRVKDAEVAFETAVKRGARPFTQVLSKDHDYPAVYGIGDSLIYFVDNYGDDRPYEDLFDIAKSPTPAGFGFIRVDHLTNNVPAGEMEKWKKFYETVFNFKETRYFDIRGKKTGLYSKVMSSPCGKIVIPINEPTENKSQIQEYLDEYHGSGIQHLALLTNDCLDSVAKLRNNGIEFLEVPNTYYDMLPERVPNVTENNSKLRELKILVDGDEEGYLLQIFTKNLIGPIFFEIIQRKNHSGFGEGNFQALFDAIERDQQARGYL
jgi:4-hydroxyphenylpyruvate dioxygenase